MSVWFTTWPANGKPQYAEHHTEQAAEAHAQHIIRTGTAAVATYFEHGALEISA